MNDATAGVEAPPEVPRAVAEVAIIAPSIAPYRVHLHRRIVRELAAVRLWSVFTHEGGIAPWAFQPPAEINPISFGPGESGPLDAYPKHLLHEWRKAGRIIR